MTASMLLFLFFSLTYKSRPSAKSEGRSNVGEKRYSFGESGK